MNKGNNIKNIYPFAIICAAVLFLLPMAGGSAEGAGSVTSTIIPIVLFIISLWACFQHGFSILLSVIVLVLSIISLKIYGSAVLGPQAAGYFLVSLAGDMIGNMVGKIFRGQKEISEIKKIPENIENPENKDEM